MYVKLHFGKINTLYYTFVMSLSGKFVMLYSIFCTRELCWMRLYEMSQNCPCYQGYIFSIQYTQRHRIQIDSFGFMKLYLFNIYKCATSVYGKPQSIRAKFYCFIEIQQMLILILTLWIKNIRSNESACMRN